MSGTVHFDDHPVEGQIRDMLLKPVSRDRIQDIVLGCYFPRIRPDGGSMQRESRGVHG